MDHSTTAVSDLAAAAIEIADSPLCRVWLAGPADLCGSCALAPECPERRECLHLSASVGLTRRIDGPFRRFPIGAREVGRVARTLEPFVLNESIEHRQLAEPAWLQLHAIASFGAWPIHQDGRCLGVLAVFGRRALGDAQVQALTALCRIAATAMTAASPAPDRQRAEPPASVPPADRILVDEDRASAATMVEVQRQAILAALGRTGGKLSGPGGAAELLGMKPTTLESRIRKLGLRRPPRLRLR